MIRIFSDLHLEFGKRSLDRCINICKRNGHVKNLVLAGDITNFKKRNEILPLVVSELKKYHDNIFYVLGNHEFYTNGGDIHNDIKDYKKICSELRIILLDNDHYETDDFVFYGTTLWSNVTKDAYKRMNDKYSFNDIQEVLDVHEKSIELLGTFIDNYQVPKPLIVVTHHLPSFELIDPVYRDYNQLNTGFASNLDHLIKDPVKLWIYGHTHRPNDIHLNSVRLVCNPHGYPNERNYYTDCVVNYDTI